MSAPDLLKILSSEVNLRILSILRSGAFNPRELAKVLGKDETDVSRRLRALERAGLVEGKWVTIRGKNVKMYSLKVNGIKISFEPDGIKVDISKAKGVNLFVPVYRPPDIEVFVGRKREITEITSTQKGVVVIYGMVGIGKTALASKIFRDAFWHQLNEEDGLDYILWKIGVYLNSRGYSSLLDYIRTGEKNERLSFDLLVEGVNKTESILVFDDFHRCQDEGIRNLVSFLVPRIRKGRLVIVSREKPSLGVENVMYLPLGGLEPEDAFKLLEIKGQKLPPEEFAKLYEITGGHPLALNLFAEAGGRSYFDSGNFFDFLFDEIYNTLNENERKMLSIMAVFEEPIEYEALRYIYGKNVFPVVYSLLRKGLIERRNDEYFLHEIIRGLARRNTKVAADEIYMNYVEYLLSKNSPVDFIRAVRYTLKAGRMEPLGKLTELRMRRFRSIVIDFSDSYLSVLTQARGNPFVDSEIAEIYYQRGFFDKAEELWQIVRDKLPEFHRANVLSYLSDLYIEKNNLKRAREYLEETELLAKILNDPLVWLWYYMERTKFEYYHGNLDKALESALREMETLKAFPADPELEVKVLFHIGDVYCEMGLCRKAVDYYNQALHISEIHGMTFNAYMAKFELSKAYYNMKEYTTASQFANEAVEYFMKIKNYRRAVDSLAYLTVALIGLKRLKDAEDAARKMVALGQSTNYPLAWAGYLFLGAIMELRGLNGSEYFTEGRKHLKKFEWLHEAILHELRKVVDIPI